MDIKAGIFTYAGKIIKNCIVMRIVFYYTVPIAVDIEAIEEDRLDRKIIQ